MFLSFLEMAKNQSFLTLTEALQWEVITLLSSETGLREIGTTTGNNISSSKATLGTLSAGGLY